MHSTICDFRAEYLQIIKLEEFSLYMSIFKNNNNNLRGLTVGL